MSITVIEPTKKTTELSVIADKIDTGLQAFENRKSELMELKKEANGLKITSIEDKAAVNQVSTIRKKLKSARVEVEKEGKGMRDPLTRLSKFISEKEKELVSIIEPTEKELIDQEKWVDSELDKIKQAAIDERLQKLAFTGKAFDRIYIGSLDDTTFNMVVNSNRADYEKEQAEKAEAERLRIEEAARLKAEREELEKLRADQAKAQVIIDAENERIRKEQREKEIAIQAEGQKLEEDKIAAQLEKNRIEAEKQKAIEIEQARKDAAEKAIEYARIEAERKAKELQAAKEKAERDAALRPDKEKLNGLIEHIGSIQYFETSDIKVQSILDDVHSMIAKVQSFIAGKIKEL